MTEGVKGKPRCVIRYYFCDFDEVWSKRENDKHDV